MNTRRVLFYTLAMMLCSVLLWGCSCQQLVNDFGPTTQPLNDQQSLDRAQRQLDDVAGAMNLAHSLGAFSKPAEWALVQSYEAKAQSAVNLLAAGIQARSNAPTLAQLEKDAGDAITLFKKNSSR